VEFWRWRRMRVTPKPVLLLVVFTLFPFVWAATSLTGTARWVFEGGWAALVVLVAVLLTVPGRKKRAQAKAEWAARREAALAEWERGDYDEWFS
jgi:hypothetical protein